MGGRRVNRREVIHIGAGALGAPLIAGCAAPTGSAGSTVETNWPKAGFNVENTGVAPEGAGPIGKPRELWCRKPGHEVTAPPAVADAAVYFCTLGGLVQALSDDRGEKLSETRMQNPCYSTPTIAQDRVFIPNVGGVLWTFDAVAGSQTGLGRIQWRADANGPLTGPATVIDDQVYAGTFNGVVHAFDVETGTEQWRTVVGQSADVTPAVGRNHVYITIPQGMVIALDADTGEEVWTTTLRGGFSTSAAVWGKRVYAVTKTTKVYDGEVRLYALDAGTGSEVWSSPVAGSPVGPPTVTDGTVTVSTWEKTLHAFDGRTGRQRWMIGFDYAPIGRPVMAGNLIYVSILNRWLVAVNAASGTRKWTRSVPGISSPPVVASGRLYATTTEPGIVALAQ